MAAATSASNPAKKRRYISAQNWPAGAHTNTCGTMPAMKISSMQFNPSKAQVSPSPVLNAEGAG